MDHAVSYFTIPYLPTVSEKFKYIIKDLNVKLLYFNLNKLNYFIKAYKKMHVLNL